MERRNQRKIAEIDRGLFLIRYEGADDNAPPPKVTVASDPIDDKNVSLLLDPDSAEAVLWQPGSALVVRAAAFSRLSIEVESLRDSGSTVASVKVERLSQGEPMAEVEPRRQAISAPLDLTDFKVLGHVAGAGDVVVGANEWLAGPSGPARIEGISINWTGRPKDFDIRYAVKLARPQPISGRMQSSGTFAGTRGRALPVVGVVIEMGGQAASNYQFTVEAVFLGSPIMYSNGTRVALSGPTGREPLVGLRVNLEQIDVFSEPIIAPSKAAARAVSPRANGGVRVFRRRAKADQTFAS